MAQEDYTGPSNWVQFQDWDTGAIDFSDDDYMLSLAQNLVDVDVSAADLAKYMPKYDRRGEANIRTEMDWMRQDRQWDKLQQVNELGDIGRGKQEDLLKLAQDKFGAGAGSGFKSTGNPMIDRQRANIYSDINRGVERQFGQISQDDALANRELWRSEQDILDMREEFQQDFGERLIDFEDMREAEIEANEKSWYEGTGWWDKTLGKNAFGQGWGSTWDNTLGKDGFGGWVGDRLGI